MIKLTSIITESSLSRVWQHVNSDRPIAILTAFRDEFTYEENHQRNLVLAARIKQAGYGYFYLDGHWIENEGTKNEVNVSEDAVFAIGGVGTDAKFEALMKMLGNKFKQDGILIKTNGKTKVIYLSTDTVVPLTTFTTGKLGQAYSQLRNNKKANTFVFESERNGKTFLWHVANNTTNKEII